MPTTDRAQPTHRVLVVDDDPVIRMFVTQAMRAIGLEAEEAESGEQALEMIHSAPPDLVVLDVDMEGIDGFETCIAIRSGTVGNDIPVMIATGLTDTETMERAFEAGASDYIKKPMDWQIIQHRVRFLLRAHGAFKDLQDVVLELGSSQQRLANAQRLAKLGDWQWRPESNEMLWSDEVYEILEIAPGRGTPSHSVLMSAIRDEDRSAFEEAMQTALGEHKPWTLEHRIDTGRGEQRVVRQQAEVTLGPDGEVETVTGTIQDVTEQRENEDRIHFLAYYDSLTSLPNQEMLTRHLDRAIRHAELESRPLALLCLDINRFERINDTLGREMGDRFLQAFANRLEDCVRATDFLAYVGSDIEPVSRLGGDEFTIVLDHVRSGEDAAIATRRILDYIAEPLTVDGHSIVMSASVGIAVFPRDASDVDSLLRRADAAVHQAKKSDHADYHFFDATLDQRAARNLQLETLLRAAVDEDGLELHYQPKFDSRTGEMVGAEALMRWHSEQLGQVSPGEFIPLAEDVGLIGSLGEWALRQACREIDEWSQQGLEPVKLAVNVSSLQVRSGRLTSTIHQLLDEYSIDPQLMEIEITESALLDGSEDVVAELAAVKDLGLTIALDDFGTGYSSLSYLTRFPIDTVKLDGSFVSGIGTCGSGSAIVAAVIGLAHRLEMNVVAEGVETEAQADYLRSEGCDVLQGFLYSRPVPAAELTTLIRLRPSD